MTRPQYRLPSMAEICALPDSGLRVVSTFAGAGGSSTGYRMAGAQVLWASEFIPAAAETYAANMAPHTVLDRRDIRTVSGAEILDAIGLGVGDLDVLDGSPPCASFSTAGKREAGWGKTRKYSDGEQRSDDLFGEFSRLLTEIQPKVFVAENVTGLVKGTAKGYFKAIFRALSAAGYRVQARRLDASWLGVPQARQRIIFVGVREDLGRDPVYPTPLPYRYTVRDVLPALAYQGVSGEWGTSCYAPTDRPSSTLGTSPSFGNGHSPPGTVISSGPLIIARDWTRGNVVLDGDAPFPCVMAAGAAGAGMGQVGITEHRRLIHDPGGQESFAVGDVSDRPVNTITSGINAVNSQHWKLQELAPARLMHDTSGKEGTGFAKVTDLSDRPSCVITVAPTPYKLDAIPGGPGPTWEGDAPHCPETGRPLAITSKADRIAVPEGHVLRRLTIPELRILCGFPADFILTGTYEQRWERLGRAVPPPMMAAIAAAIRDAGLCAG